MDYSFEMSIEDTGLNFNAESSAYHGYVINYDSNRLTKIFVQPCSDYPRSTSIYPVIRQDPEKSSENLLLRKFILFSGNDGYLRFR